jgi:hypothetical protein
MFPSGRIDHQPLMDANCRSNAAFDTGTATILTITSGKQAEQNPPEQLVTSAAIRTIC